MLRKVLKTYDRKNTGKQNFSTIQTQSVLKPLESREKEDKQCLNDTLDDPFNTTFDRLLKEYKNKPVPPPISGLCYIPSSSEASASDTFSISEYKSKTQKKKPRLKQIASPKKNEKNIKKPLKKQKEEEAKRNEKQFLKPGKMKQKKVKGAQEKIKLPVKRRKISTSESENDSSDPVPENVQISLKDNVSSHSEESFKTNYKRRKRLSSLEEPNDKNDQQTKKLQDKRRRRKSSSASEKDTSDLILEKQTSVQNNVKNLSEECKDLKNCFIFLEPCDWKCKKKEEVSKIKPCTIQIPRLSETQSALEENNLGKIKSPMILKKCTVRLTRVESPKISLTERIASSTPFVRKKSNLRLEAISPINLEISNIKHKSNSSKIPQTPEELKTPLNLSVRLEDINASKSSSFKNNLVDNIDATENWNDTSDYSEIDWETVSYSETKEPPLQAKYRSRSFGNETSKNDNSSKNNLPEIPDLSRSKEMSVNKNLKVTLTRCDTAKEKVLNETSMSLFDDTNDNEPVNSNHEKISILSSDKKKGQRLSILRQSDFCSKDKSSNSEIVSPMTSIPTSVVNSLSEERKKISQRSLAFENILQFPKKHLNFDEEFNNEIDESSEIKCDLSSESRIENSVESRQDSKIVNTDLEETENKSELEVLNDSPLKKENSLEGKSSIGKNLQDKSQNSILSENSVKLVSESLLLNNQNSLKNENFDLNLTENSPKDDSENFDLILSDSTQNSKLMDSQNSHLVFRHNSLNDENQNPILDISESSVKNRQNSLLDESRKVMSSDKALVVNNIKNYLNKNENSVKEESQNSLLGDSQISVKLDSQDSLGNDSKNFLQEDSKDSLQDGNSLQDHSEISQKVPDSPNSLKDESSVNVIESSQNLLKDCNPDLNDSQETVLYENLEDLEEMSETSRKVEDEKLKNEAVNNNENNSKTSQSELKDSIQVTCRRKNYQNWGLQLSAIEENESMCSGETEIETSQVNREQPEHLFLKPGKSWARSLSILSNIHSQDDVDRFSVGKGSKWRKSVISILDRQNKGILQSCASQQEISNSPSCSQIVNKNVDHSKIERFSQIGSISPNRFVKRISIRVVPDNTKLNNLEDTQFLEAYGITSSQSSQRFSSTQENNFVAPVEENVIFNSHLEETVIKTVDSQPLVTAKDVVLEKCHQSNYLPFKKCYPSKFLKNCRKIGEGVYGEVFLHEHESDSSVIKIIPIEGNELVNGEHQKKFHEILSEIVIAKELHDLRFNEKYNTSSFVEVKDIKCIKGKYPQELIELWDEFDHEKKSENDCPSMFENDQLYISLELGNAGQDLEAFVFQNANECYSVFIQTALALAVAEKSLEFEHRDLHWGNILISRTKKSQVSYKLGNAEINLDSNGLKVAIIDFTLSRMSYNGCFIFNDLALDPSLFTAEGEYQFEIYRLMRDKLGNDWQTFDPFTNILWLHYTLDKMITSVRYNKKKKLTKIHKNGIDVLKEMKAEILSYDSAFDLVTKCDKFTTFYDNLDFSTADSA